MRLFGYAPLGRKGNRLSWPSKAVQKSKIQYDFFVNFLLKKIKLLIINCLALRYSYSKVNSFLILVNIVEDLSGFKIILSFTTPSTTL